VSEMKIFILPDKGSNIQQYSNIQRSNLTKLIKNYYLQFVLKDSRKQYDDSNFLVRLAIV